MKFQVFFLFILFVKEYTCIRCECKPKTHSSNPVNTNLTRKSIYAEIDHSVVIGCCVDGFTEIEWWFKNSSDQISCINDDRYTCNKENTCLTIKKINSHSYGNYTCVARDNFKRSISVSVALKQDCTVIINPFVHIKNYTDDGKVHENEPIHKCVTANYKGSEINRPFIEWELPNNTSINVDGLTNTEMGYINLSKTEKKIDGCNQNYTIKTCFYIMAMKKEYIGNYTCHFIIGHEAQFTFLFDILPPSIPWWVIYVTVGCFVLLCIIVIVWYCYYDIMLIKTRKQRGDSKKSYNIAFIYDTKTEKMIEFVNNLCTKLESYNLVTYFYDRDKAMGKAILDEYQTATDNSNIIVYILTPDILLRDDLLFAARERIESTIVLYYPSQQKIRKLIPNFPPNKRPLFEEIIKSDNKWTLGLCQFSGCFCCKRRLIQWIRYQERTLNCL